MPIEVFIFRLACALLAGIIIGTQRELKQRQAGLTTNSLVAVGACIFILISGRTASPSTVSPPPPPSGAALPWDVSAATVCGVKPSSPSQWLSSSTGDSRASSSTSNAFVAASATTATTRTLPDEFYLIEGFGTLIGNHERTGCSRPSPFI